jgi:hypothetical protein
MTCDRDTEIQKRKIYIALLNAALTGSALTELMNIQQRERVRALLARE